MNAPRHEMILASAGSGKTHALTDRFVALLAAGAAPDRIVALTFTRKAAGEFFDEILKKLAGAAGDAGKAARLATDIGAPKLGTGDFLALLRKVIDAMHRLRLGTLDSFFAQVVSAFPLELGLAGEFTVLEAAAERLERQRVLRRIFARSGALTAAQQEFIEAFKRATFGREEKRLGAQLDGFLGDFLETYLNAPDAAAWGNPARIWPEGCVWLAPQSGPLDDAVQALRTALAGRDLTEKQRGRWAAFFDELADWSPGIELGKMKLIVGNALAVWPDLQAGAAELMVERKKIALGPNECAALRRIVTEIVGGELRRRLETTQGIFAVLRGYEEVYGAEVRRTGRLTFADVQRLLAPTAGAPRLAQDDSGEGRLLIDYRLDAEIDHWLLDEFQDTSRGQWSVLQNLIDEAVQDAERRRSFFCVGDVKQSIYQWREGDPRLFREIFNHYNAAVPGSVSERPLAASWRSGPPLIEMVNAVFGASEAVARLFPGAASAEWNEVWRNHTSAVPQRTGQAAWLHAEDQAARWATTLWLLQELQPLAHGLSCAVLVRKNDTATALADYLRRESGGKLPAVAESDLCVAADNSLGAALLALVQAAAHPGDTLAQEHVRMTPLGAVLAAEQLNHPEQITTRVLGQIHAEGFARMAEWWLARLEPQLASDDAFSRLRARQFVAAAGEFDATGSRDVAEFVAFMEAHQVRDTESAAVVRVMTVHKSKGLGFDVVLLPDLEGKTLEERRKGLAVQKASDRSVDWVLDLPPEPFRDSDPVLAAHTTAAKAAACYENLSVLYVAMTRAKRGFYVITKAPGDSASANFPRLLAETLGDDVNEVRVGGLTLPGAWSAGDADWHRMLPKVERSTDDKPVEPALGAELTRVVRRPARRASAEKVGVLGFAQLFSLAGTGAAEFGTAVHGLLAEVEWLEGESSVESPEPSSRNTEAGGGRPEAIAGGGATEALLEKLETTWRTRGTDAAAREVALACLRAPGLAAVWARPPGAAAIEVWRERAFEIVLGDEWVSGVFDRVIVVRDAVGTATRATVFDFKTDAAPDPARHANQMSLYRRAAARLLGLPENAVVTELVFTATRTRVVV